MYVLISFLLIRVLDSSNSLVLVVASNFISSVVNICVAVVIFRIYLNLYFNHQNLVHNSQLNNETFFLNKEVTLNK